MADQREMVISFIQENGPALPVQISKHLDTSILFSSAILSELVSRRMLRLSAKSIGGSPVYFLDGQEEKVCHKLFGSLKAPEKDLIKNLEEKKVLYEHDLEAWQRISLAQLKDYAIPLDVTLEGTTQRFWKHVLISDQEAREHIQSFLESHQEEISKEEQIPEAQIIQAESPKEQELIQEIPIQQEAQQTLTSNSVETLEEKRGDTPSPELDIEKIKQELMKEMRKELMKSMKQNGTTQETLKKPEPKKIDGPFYDNCMNYFKKNNIKVTKEEELKKGDLEFHIKIPTNIGPLSFYAKARDKKVINDGDLSSAFSSGQLKKLPVLFLSSGKLTKKAESLASSKFEDHLFFRNF